MMQPQTSYLLCGTQRSGSTLLCEALTLTGVAGLSEEYFSPADEPIWQERWRNSTYEEYLANVFQQATTPNGVFGAKMMWSYFGHFVSEVRRLPDYKGELVAVHDLLQAVFPNLHYIWIKRHDKVRQAVSVVRALQTKVWKVTTDTPIAPKPKNKPVFSFWQIDYWAQKLEAHEAAWQQYFMANNIQPFIVEYEDFVLKYEETTIQILKYLRISETERIQFEAKRMKKQADEESEQWVQRYQYLKIKSKRHHLVSLANRFLLALLQSKQLESFRTGGSSKDLISPMRTTIDEKVLSLEDLYRRTTQPG